MLYIDVMLFHRRRFQMLVIGLRCNFDSQPLAPER